MENKDIMVVDNTEEMMDYVCPIDEEDDGPSGLTVAGIIGAAALAGAGVTALVAKKRDDIKDWRTRRRIKKLEKEGYTVTYEVVDEDIDSDESK